MPEKSANLRRIIMFALFALPAALLATGFWLGSISTPYFKSQGQILLGIVLLIPLLGFSGLLFLNYLRVTYLKPLEKVTNVLQSILTKSFRPIPESFNLQAFKPIYILLTQLNDSFAKDSQNLAQLTQTSSAEAKLFEIALSEIADPVVVLNLRNQVKFVNRAAEDLSGMQRIDIVGRPVDQYLRLYDKNNQEILPSKYTSVAGASDESKIFRGSEVKIISNVNKQSFADLSVFKSQMSQAIDVSVVLVFHDRSKEKQLEAMKLDFVSMAAHELRTPLTSIKGYISVFINENEKKLTPDQMMFIRRINTSAQQLAGLVENLLSVARVERGAMNLHTQVVDWVTNVSQQVETFLHRAEEKRIKLEFIHPNKPIAKVEVDLVRINEVLNNLVSNALNYTEPMGKISVWIDQKDEMVYTFVKDSGKGIPKDALLHLFSKFFRVQGGPAEQASKGNGLGLYLSKAIVELHHGKIWAESEGLGKGSTFGFSLPSVKENVDISVLTKKV